MNRHPVTQEIMNLSYSSKKMAKNPWLSYLRRTLLDPQEMDNPKYSDEYLQLRADCFIALSSHLNDHCRAVFEFCNDYVENNNSIDNIEEKFQEYLRTIAENSYAKNS